jgi:hypothetical protein
LDRPVNGIYVKSIIRTIDFQGVANDAGPVDFYFPNWGFSVLYSDPVLPCPALNPLDTNRFNMEEFWNALSQQMKPRFHEISMYLIALSFCWLFLFHPELRRGFFIFFSGFESMSPFFVFLGLVVTGGLLLSLIHVFIKRKKLAFEKSIMGWSVLGISSASSFLAGTEMLTSRSSVMAILVAWNILMSVLMLFQMGMQKYDVSDEDASFAEVFVTTVVLLVTLLFADLYFHLSWAMTLSICIFYSTAVVFIVTWIVNYFDLQLPDILK